MESSVAAASTVISSVLNTFSGCNQADTYHHLQTPDCVTLETRSARDCLAWWSFGLGEMPDWQTTGCPNREPGILGPVLCTKTFQNVHRTTGPWVHDRIYTDEDVSGAPICLITTQGKSCMYLNSEPVKLSASAFKTVLLYFFAKQ